MWNIGTRPDKALQLTAGNCDFCLCVWVATGFGWVVILAILISSGLVGCGGPSIEELEAVDYTPLPADDWEVSTPADQGLDPMLVAKLYHNAAELETLFGAAGYQERLSAR